MREEFEKLVFAGKIKPDQVDKLIQLAEGSYCMHKSWGFGRITAVDTVLSRFNIDFVEKPGHALDLGFAAKTLESISADHILARKMSDLEGLQKMAALSHLDLIKVVFRSYGGKATADRIQKDLVPDVITSDWKKWWETCKREMKKSGHFTVPSKKSLPIEFTEEEVTLQQRLEGEFVAAKGLKSKAAVAAEMIKNIEELDDAATLCGTVIPVLNEGIKSYQRTQPALSLEGVFVRDEFRKATKAEAPAEAEVTESEIWGQDVTLAGILEKLPAARHRRTLQSYFDNHPETWSDAVLALANNATQKLCGECVSLLVNNGKFGLFKEALARLISQHQASTDLLLWFAKDRSDSFADIFGPEVFRAMISAIERDFFNEKKSVRLADYVMGDQDLLPQMIESADLEVVKDLTRALQSTNAFDDMDKRSLLARIVKIFPSIQELISGGGAQEDRSLVVSWESLLRRKEEYDNIIKKEIPDNRKDIAIARSYGDLRENSEYKGAKEHQRVLMRRKAELERDLGLARGTDFSEATSQAVGIGTRIEVTDLGSNEKKSFEILGAWDGDPDKGLLSYQSPLAMAFSGKKAGEEAEYSWENSTTHYRVDSIDTVEVRPMPQDAAAEDADETDESPSAAPESEEQAESSPAA